MTVFPEWQELGGCAPYGDADAVLRAMSEQPPETPSRTKETADEAG